MSLSLEKLYFCRVLEYHLIQQRGDKIEVISENLKTW